MPPTRQIEDVFRQKVQKGAADDCWEWTGFRTKLGYGVVWYQKRSWQAHRVAWTLANGPIETGMHILHRCDNRACCNPSHLFSGTHQNNMDDMNAKGRGVRNMVQWAKEHRHRPQSVGERNVNAKITEDHVREIRSLRSGGLTAPAIARQMSLPLSLVEQVVSGRTWKHVK